MGLILYIITYILDPIVMVCNFFVVLWKNIRVRGFLPTTNGYFMSDAISRDEFANYNYRTFWNTTFRKSSGYPFGVRDETISSALGRNQIKRTLSWFGWFIVLVLYVLDYKYWFRGGHCLNSIKGEPKRGYNKFAKKIIQIFKRLRYATNPR